MAMRCRMVRGLVLCGSPSGFRFTLRGFGAVGLWGAVRGVRDVICRPVRVRI